MKRPGYRHTSKQIKIYCPVDLTREKREELANSVSYAGSPDHKKGGNAFHIRPSSPRPKPASICDNDITPARASDYLRCGIRNGHLNWVDGDAKYPRYVWFKDQSVVYQARLINKETGSYKGWPLSSDETVEGME